MRGDFQEFHQLDLADVWRGTITPRRFFDLAESLLTIPRSRYRAAVMGDPRWMGWSAETSLLADVYDATLGAAAQNLAIWGGKASPKLHPRPKTNSPAEHDTPSAKPGSKIADFPIWDMVRATS